MMGAVFLAVVFVSIVGAVGGGFVILVMAGIRFTRWIRRRARERKDWLVVQCDGCAATIWVHVWFRLFGMHMCKRCGTLNIILDAGQRAGKDGPT